MNYATTKNTVPFQQQLELFVGHDLHNLSIPV